MCICHGLTIIDPNDSDLTATKQNAERNIYDNDNGNPSIMDIADNEEDDSSHHRLLNHHMINTLDQLDDSDELNEQITILSNRQSQENIERKQHLDSIVNFLQV